MEHGWLLHYTFVAVTVWFCAGTSLVELQDAKKVCLVMRVRDAMLGCYPIMLLHSVMLNNIEVQIA